MSERGEPGSAVKPGTAVEKGSAGAVVEIMVNGEPRSVRAGSTLAEALRALGAPNEGFAVERNGKIVPRSRHDEVCLAPGDRLEIVTFVGGG